MSRLTDPEREQIMQVFGRVKSVNGTAVELGHDRATVRRVVAPLLGGGTDPGSPMQGPESTEIRAEAIEELVRRALAKMGQIAPVDEGPPAPQGVASEPAPAPALKPLQSPDGVAVAPKLWGRILWLSDLHVPYHDAPAIHATLDMAAAWRPELIILGGDLFDSYLISHYRKDPGRLRDTLQSEFDAARVIVKRIEDLKPANVVFILGNHEARIDSLISDNPGLEGLRALAWHKMAELPERWEILPQFSRYRVGHLDFHHGDLMQGPGGVHVGKNMLMKLKRSSLFGHFHREQGYFEPDGDGVVRGSFATGHLCNEAEAAKYCRLNNWAKGFKSIDMDEASGLFEVRSHLIHRGRFRFQGVIYGG